MRKQYKLLVAFALAFILSFGGFAMASDAPSVKDFTFNESDIHKPIFVVEVQKDNTDRVKGTRAIYRIFFTDNNIDESYNPTLNLWTDEKGSKRVLR